MDYSPDLAEKLKLFSTPYLRGTAGGLTERAARESRIGVQARDSEAARVRAVATLEAEIELFCAVLSRAPQPAQYQPPHVINIPGSSVADLQTGNHSSATLTNVSVSSQHSDVAAAVAALKAELHAADVEGAPIFLVQEAEAELTKVAPQRSRLKGFVDAIGSCASGAINVGTKLPDAVEGAKRAIEILPF
ncbi:hypothetical protein IM543_21680 [Massilia sp. UMI-21]|nr:hypothetical protein IM543_21680 [Massilia sp. UMI-21]